MPFGKIILRPGVNVEASPTLNKGGISLSQLIRFKLGLAEKLGGWLAYCQTPVVGTGTGMKSFSGLDGTTYLMVGTEQRLCIITSGILYDITPVRLTHNIAPALTTTNLSKTVRIADAGSGTAPGDWVYITVPIAIDGLVLQGFYQVSNTIDPNTYEVQAATAATATTGPGGAVPAFTTVNGSAVVTVALNNHGYATNDPFVIGVATTGGGITLAVGSYTVTRINANQFTIVASAVATGSVTFSENGGNARFEYLIQTGFSNAVVLSGWGIGVWGAGVWGLSSGSTVRGLMRQWSADAWGSSLVACYTKGPIYEWDPPVTNVFPGNRATPAFVLTNAPNQNICIFVHSQSEILVAAGCSDSGGTFDPLLVRWSDQDDLTVWVGASGNQAGLFRLKSGSRIVGSMMVPQGGLIWTDAGVWSMQYIGYPDIFGFTVVGVNCGLIGMRARAYLNSSVLWMGRDNFYIMAPGGTPQAVPCTVWDKVFRNLNSFQVDEIFCAVSSLFNEIWIFYPSANSDAVDSYVKVNLSEGYSWDFGLLPRTCWDDGLVLGAPVGCDSMGLVQQHETSPDANGAPLMWSLTTGFYDIAEGEEFCYIDQVWPDFVQTDASIVQMTINVVDEPGGPVRSAGPFSFTQGQKQFQAFNLRGRQVQFVIGGSDLGSFVRLGAIRYRFGGAGRRGG